MIFSDTRLQLWLTVEAKRFASRLRSLRTSKERGDVRRKSWLTLGICWIGRCRWRKENQNLSHRSR